MGWFQNAFTWWEGASWGTNLMTRMRGEQVGEDEAGNLYFKSRKDASRRWVIYKGSNDSSRVPPGWNAWLRGTIDALPQDSLPARRPFEADYRHNLTGTSEAHRPAGSLSGKARRAAATGDYEAWTPE